MKQCMMTIVENMALTHDTYRMRLEGDVSAFDAPGQFLDIQLEGHFLRRPVSLCDLDTLVEVAAETGYIKADDRLKILQFRDDPSDESWIGMKA